MLTHAAAISYYTVFSLPSMLLIVLWTAAQFYKEDAVYDAIFEKITAYNAPHKLDHLIQYSYSKC